MGHSVLDSNALLKSLTRTGADKASGSARRCVARVACTGCGARTTDAVARARRASTAGDDVRVGRAQIAGQRDPRARETVARLTLAGASPTSTRAVGWTRNTGGGECLTKASRAACGARSAIGCTGRPGSAGCALEGTANAGARVATKARARGGSCCASASRGTGRARGCPRERICARSASGAHERRARAGARIASVACTRSRAACACAEARARRARGGRFAAEEAGRARAARCVACAKCARGARRANQRGTGAGAGVAIGACARGRRHTAGTASWTRGARRSRTGGGVKRVGRARCGAAITKC
jgi:hypothetical protein